MLPTATAANTPGRLRAVVHEQENRIRPRRRESGHAYDAQGNLLLERDSLPHEPYKFRLSEADIAYLQGKAVTLVHNHPRAYEYPSDDPRRAGNAFSPADVRVACRIEAGEYRAVSPAYRFSLKPPPGGWNTEYWQKVAGPCYARHERTVRAQFRLRARREPHLVAALEADLRHEVCQRMAKELGMEYHRERS